MTRTCALAGGIAGVLNWAPLQAEVNFNPQATARYEHNSNVFATEEGRFWQTPDGELRQDDNYWNYGVGLNTDYLWRQNRAYLNGEYRRYTYENFTQMDRNEYNFLAGTDLQITRRAKGGLTARYERLQVPFSDLGLAQVGVGTQVPEPYIRINRNYGASGSYLFGQHWEVASSVNYSSSSLPDYDVKETPWRAELRYLGAASLNASFAVDGTEGEYEGVADAPTFSQIQYTLSADYKLGQRATLVGSVGYAKRSQPGSEIDANTGSLSFNHQLTQKTSYYLQYTRAVTGYLTTLGAQLDNSFQVGASWQARQKLGLTVNYSYTRSRVEGEFIADQIDVRNDTTRSYGGSLNYNVFKYITLSPYYRYDDRESDNAAFTYDAEVYGIELRARYR